MRPHKKNRRAWGEYGGDPVRVDRVTGEPLVPEEPITWVYCPVCEWVDEGELWTDHFLDCCGYGRSCDGFVYGAMWGDDVGEWPVRGDRVVLYDPFRPD